MILKTEKQEFHAHFFHHPVSKRRRERHHLMTEVRLHPGPCKLEGSKEEGTRRCVSEALHAEARQNSKLDSFDKRTGRIVALTRALAGVTGDMFPRPLRKQIWKSYFEQAKLPKARGTR